MKTSKLKYILSLIVLLLLGAMPSQGQNDRNFIRQGNRSYRAKKFTQAEVAYRKALSKNGKNPQAVYNLGCALMMQQKDSLALQQYASAAQLEPNKMRRAKSYHNMGVIMQNHQEFAKAIEFYKMALRNNPQDNETRYNLALCKRQLKNQPQQNKQNQQNKNNKDKNKDKNKNNQDKNNQNKNQNQNKDKNNQDKQQDKKQNQQNKQNQDQMSRDNAEQLLNAAVQQEKATKQKMQKAMSQPRRKQYDKNW